MLENIGVLFRLALLEFNHEMLVEVTFFFIDYDNNVGEVIFHREQFLGFVVNLKQNPLRVGSKKVKF